MKAQEMGIQQKERLMEKPDEIELVRRLCGAEDRVTVDAVYVHKRTGGWYNVDLIALNEKTCEPVVIYTRIGESNNLAWVRPIDEFSERFTIYEEDD